MSREQIGQFIFVISAIQKLGINIFWQLKIVYSTECILFCNISLVCLLPERV